MIEPVFVTAAVVIENGRVLVARRPPGGRHPGSWEFPGGKVEEGETPEECLAREMMEEMGVQVSVGDMLASVKHSYPDLAVELHAFECTVTGGRLRDIGCSEHQWVEPTDLGRFDLLPPDRELLELVFGEG